MTYNQFLFSQLLRDLVISANEKEYDLLFDVSKLLYERFENSEENKQEKMTNLDEPNLDEDSDKFSMIDTTDHEKPKKYNYLYMILVLIVILFGLVIVLYFS